jgi:hypothetical protein
VQYRNKLTFLKQRCVPQRLLFLSRKKKIMSQVVLSPDSFAVDLEMNLGRANGNVYQRQPGIPGVNDGQIMVRLKKKRYIIIDYSIKPNEADFHEAELSPHIAIPEGAGQVQCTAPNCSKVGVPVLLYDSEPGEPASLYLRSGLCFQCQRDLNEKRRTDRKRPVKANQQYNVDGPSIIYAIGPSQKKFKLNGKTIHLHSDALIINGSVEGTKHFRDGYGFQEIGVDLHQSVQEAVMDTEQLLHSVSNNNDSAAAATLGGNTELDPDPPPSSVFDMANELLHHHHYHDPDLPSNSEDINILYDKAFQTLNKSIILLSQWKASWDAAIAAAHETVTDPSLADAVASAAAVVAAAADGSDQSGSNMVSLLLAADKRKDDSSDGDEQGHQTVDHHFEV